MTLSVRSSVGWSLWHKLIEHIDLNKNMRSICTMDSEQYYLHCLFVLCTLPVLSLSLHKNVNECKYSTISWVNQATEWYVLGGMGYDVHVNQGQGDSVGCTEYSGEPGAASSVLCTWWTRWQFTAHKVNQVIIQCVPGEWSRWQCTLRH